MTPGYSGNLFHSRPDKVPSIDGEPLNNAQHPHVDDASWGHSERKQGRIASECRNPSHALHHRLAQHAVHPTPKTWELCVGHLGVLRYREP